MKNVFIFHGAYGNPSENWFPWLKTELEKQGIEVIVPKFPTPENQNLENWLNVFNQYKNKVNKDTIFVGHSIGAAFILRNLKQIEQKIKASFLIAGFITFLNDPVFDKLNRTFLDKEFNWGKIKQNCGKFYIFQSSNDPYVPFEKAIELKEKLNTEITVVENAGHFNKEAGYTKFELLLNKINEL